MLAKRDAERAKKLAFARGNTPDTGAAALASSAPATPHVVEEAPVVPSSGALISAPVRHGEVLAKEDNGDEEEEEGVNTDALVLRPPSSGEMPFIGYAGDEPQYEEHIVEIPPKTGSDSSSSEENDEDDSEGGSGAQKAKKKKTRIELRLAPAWDTWAEGDEKSNLDGAVRRT